MTNLKRNTKTELESIAESLNLKIEDGWKKEDIIHAIENAKEPMIKEDLENVETNEMQSASSQGTSNETDFMPLKEEASATQNPAQWLTDGSPAQPLRRRSRGRDMIPRQTVFRNSGAITISADDKFTRKQTLEQEIMTDLVASMDNNIHKILTGTVIGVKQKFYNEKKFFFLTVNYKGRLVQIPAQDFFPQGISDKTEEDLKRHISKRKGSEVDFIVTYIDRENPETGYVAASRVKAMEKKKNKYWYGKVSKTDASGNRMDFLRQGIRTEARIVTVVRQGIFIEIFGVETFIPCKELSYTHLVDARESFRNGENITVVLTKIIRSKGQIDYQASYIKTIENPLARYFEQYDIGDNIIGKVTNLSTTNGAIQVFVNVQNQIDLYCRLMPGVQTVPQVGQDVDVIIKGKDANTLQIWGDISHIW